MEEHFVALQEAKDAAKIADHMVMVTYNVVNDPKLLVVVAEKLLAAQAAAIKSVLLYEVYQRRIPSFKEDFLDMFSMFKVRCSRRYQFNPAYVDAIHQVYEITQHHKTSPVEFVRKENYVICSDEYKTDVISKKFLREALEKTKSFIVDVEKMIMKGAAD
ncbi:hypothetical protein HYY69_07405 [Candidatus Woesearchaeota archaeon]|nr:hypothetical protein [Candidatus Woesearchaeota archaeon]